VHVAAASELLLIITRCTQQVADAAQDDLDAVLDAQHLRLRAPSGHGVDLRNEVTEGELSTILDRNTWSGVAVGQLSAMMRAWHWA